MTLTPDQIVVLLKALNRVTPPPKNQDVRDILVAELERLNHE